MKKRNQVFNFLEALAIIMVIDDHMSTRIGILSSIFPYNSFYMPLFVFISGYFYREQKIGENIKHKVCHLLPTYLAWAVVGEVIAYILMKLGIVNWYADPFHLKSLIRLFTIDSLTSIVGASWFVIMLFWVSVSYNILDNLFSLKRKLHDYAFLLVLMLLGIIALKLCMAKYNHYLPYLFVLRTVWYIQFYHMGRLFHRYWECHVRNWNTLYTCMGCVGVNVLLICMVGDYINFYATAGMGSFHSSILPIVTSFTGILFWYKVMQYLSEKLGGVRIVDYIAENTFTIMECHLMFVNLPNFYAYYQYLHGNVLYANFPVAKFIGGAWLRYSPNTRLIGFFCGLLGSLLTIFIIHWAGVQIKNLNKRFQHRLLR